jgi:hypothetical protein
MPSIESLVQLMVAAFRARARARGERGEIVTWVILAAGLAVIAVAVVIIVGAKLRGAANGIELQ